MLRAKGELTKTVRVDGVVNFRLHDRDEMLGLFLLVSYSILFQLYSTRWHCLKDSCEN